MDTTLQTTLGELKKARAAWLQTGSPEHRDEMHRLAQLAADQYNEKATEVAKRHGVKPRLVTKQRMLTAAPMVGRR